MLPTNNMSLNPCDEINHLSFCHVNVQSLLAGVNTALHIPSQDSKLDEIYTRLILEHKFQVIALTETWLNSNHSDDQIFLDDYNIFRRDRTTGRGGGVLTYIHHDIPCVRRADLEPAQTEMLCIEIKYGQSIVIFCTCYRPPGQNVEQVNEFFNELQQCIDSFLRLRPDCIILVGDFNDRCVVFDEDHVNSELGNRLRDMVIGNNFYQLINDATHYTERSAYILDLVIVDCPGYVMEHGVLDSICNLHHRPVYCKLSLSKSKQKTLRREVWHYNNGDFVALNCAINQYDWDDLFSSSSNLNELTSQICDKILELSQQFIPVRLITKRSKDKPWITFQFRKLIRLRNRWSRTYNRTCLEQHRITRNWYRSKVKYEFRRLKKEYFERQLLLLNNPDLCCKTFWRIAKTLYGNKMKKSVPTLLENGRQYSSDKEKVDLLNSYFASQSTLEAPSQDFSLPIFNYATEARINTINVSPEDVQKVLCSLPVNKASGPDNISNKLLKNVAPSICFPLSRLFNLCMRNSHFPDIWKVSNITPIYKKDEDYIKEHYRPISLLSCVSKVNERLVFEELYDYCISNDILNKCNSGFKKFDGTVNQLIDITHNLYSGLDKGFDMCMVFLDVSKAFDKVYHKGLIYKLRQIGVTGDLLGWLESYLNNRYCRVVLNGTSSSLLATNAGVPQGSILGPLLFLIYINDIVKNIESKIYIFADDTSLLQLIDDPVLSYDLLNRDLDRLLQWSKQWRVTFNANKTEYMLFSYKNHQIPTPELYLGTSAIKKVHSHTHLGLTFDSKLTWKSHVERISKKASQRLGNVKRIRHLIPRKTSLNLFKTLVRPIIEYADVVFDNMSIELQQKLDGIQREALIMTTGAYRRTPTENLYSDTGLERLSDRRYQHRLAVYYKMVNNISPAYLSNNLPPLSRQNTNYNFRQFGQHKRIVPFARTTRLATSFIVKTSIDWNNLNDNTASCPTLPSFKRCLKQKFVVHSLFCVYNSEPGLSGIHHTRLRLGLSALKQQLFHFGIIQNPTCEHCYLADESVYHYFLECPTFAAYRIHLMVSLINILPFELFSTLSEQELIDILLYGSNLLTKDINLKLFQCVCKFISNTGRF